jgi:hypothetical protein
MRAVYCSKDIVNATIDAGESANDLLLQAFLDYDNYANVTGGQKICASMKDSGLHFWDGSAEATAQMLVSYPCRPLIFAFEIMH